MNKAAFNLHGRLALVTGASRGLGQAIAIGLADAGATVVATGRDMAALDATIQMIHGNGGSAEAAICDVRAADDTARLVRQFSPDILVNNAGINPDYLAAENVGDDAWANVIETNLSAVFRLTRDFGRGMLDRGKGSIINITSIAGHVGLAKTAAYCAAKGGVEMMSKSIAMDWARKSVRVNCIAPGYFETDLTQGIAAHPMLSDRICARTPLGRFGLPQEIVGAALYLASDLSSYVTGQTLHVDGGWTAA